MIDLNDFPDEYREALEAADKACERAQMFPNRPDMWANTDELRKVFTVAIPALYALPFQAAAEAYQNACREMGETSMSLSEARR